MDKYNKSEIVFEYKMKAHHARRASPSLDMTHSGSCKEGKDTPLFLKSVSFLVYDE